MIYNLVLQICGWLFLVLGCVFIFSSAIGFIRMPDFFSKIHAIGISDSFGCPVALFI
jgi:multicomponent Na+:H+ antiporter subunit G